MRRLITFLLTLSVSAFVAFAQQYPYQDQSLSPEERADDLISRLTLAEKTALMQHVSVGIPRLGIKPYTWWNEALHGVGRNGNATVFPQPIGMAASFDDELLLEVFTAVSDEARIKHRLASEEGDFSIYKGLTFWTPNINIFRDPRWGRGMETYGEDPYLTGRLGIAVARGLQGSDDDPVRKLHACAKHYAVHSGPESIRHSFDAVVSERDLRETYLPAFKDLVTKANVEEVMTAYNRVYGKPAGASDKLVNEILRGEWGYKGLITSDCWAVADFYEPGRHGFSADAAEAVAAAIINGMDLECGASFPAIPEAVQRGLLPEEDIDRNLKRLIVARYKLGEMDGIDPWSALPASIVEGAEHRALALRMAEESIVLLENNGVLPLKSTESIALVGPNAHDREMMWGNYNPVPKETVTLLDALNARIPMLIYYRGCGILGSEYAPEASENPRIQRRRAPFFPELDVDATLAQLEGCGTIIFAGGISPSFEGEEMPVEVPGFYGGDKTDVELPAVQQELVKALHNAGKKVIFVNFSGSAVSFEPIKDYCDAILQAWYPGQEGGTAIANVLFGDVNPSGKLPVTFYKSIDQLPSFENYDMLGHTYRYFKGEPEYPFGYGKSYTSFRYGRLRIRDGKAIITVKNRGKVDGDEIVQLYVSRKDDSMGPIRTLRGYKRVSVPAGKKVTVEIPLTEETFTWWDEAAQNMIPKDGRYVVEVGSSSSAKDLRKKNFKYSI